MKRPEITKAIIIQAAEEIVAALHPSTGIGAEGIAKCYRHPMDGYGLAKRLEKIGYSGIVTEDVVVLDDMDAAVSRLREEAQMRWAKENDIQPLLPIGTHIKEGVITGVCSYHVATYLVKEGNCPENHPLLFVRFEDAVVETTDDASFSDSDIDDVATRDASA